MQTQKNQSGQRIQKNSYLERNRVQEEKRDRRLLLALLTALSVIVPPVGVFCTWRSGRAGTYARIGLSLAALVSMTFFCWLWMRSGSVDIGILPVPIVPAYAGYDVNSTPATPEPVEVFIPPEDQQGALTVTYGDGTVEDLSGGLPLDPTSYVTIVYAVTENAMRFHTQPVCDYQTNGRVLTLDEALAEGLQPCEKCAQQYIQRAD